MVERSLLGDVEVGVSDYIWELVDSFQFFGMGLLLENVGLS